MKLTRQPQMSSLQRNRWGVNIRQTKWGIVAQATPRGRKEPISEDDLAARNAFRMATWIIKYVDGAQKLYADKYAHGRALYPRDILMSAAYGKLYAVYNNPPPVDVGNYVLLDQVNAVDGNTTITFDNISDAYTDLIVVLAGRVKSAVTSSTIVVRFNNDSSAHYSDQRQRVQSSTTTFLGRTALQTEAEIGSLPGTTTSSTDSGNIELVIPYYAYTTMKKTGTSHFTYRNAANAWVLTAGFNGIYWDQTSAITRIDLIHTAASGFNGLTIATLYGRGQPQ